MRFTISLPVLTLLGAAALSAQAQNPIDPAQRRAEVRAAVAAGAIPRGEAPFVDQRAAQSLRARADVQREATEAVARGEIPLGEGAGSRSERFVSVKSRVEVRAETREAIRLGLVPRGELTPVPTEAQLELVRLAGERALSLSNAVAAR